jgi:uncharacterized membrane protein
MVPSDSAEFDWHRKPTPLAPARRHEEALRNIRTRRNGKTGRGGNATRSKKSMAGVATVVAVCEIAGIASLVISYSIAQTTVSDQAEFAWFWLGMALIELPLIAIVACRVISEAARYATTILLGILTYAPKLLRDPSSPDFHDEFAHWRDVYDIISTGKLFGPVPIVPIISRYPGLHATVAALVNATGLTIWQGATLLLIVLHVACFLGIAALAQAIGFDSRTAAFAAITYSFNSSFLYFDTEFGYESMAIALLIWALVAFVQAIRADSGRERAAWCCVTVLLCAGTAVTHHLSAINLAIVMALVSLALSVPWLARRQGWIRTAATAWSLTLFMGLSIAGWIHFVAPATVAYLSPYLGTGLSELMQVAAGSNSGRQLFSASLSPSWEHQAAFAVTVIAFCMAIAGVLIIRSRIKSGLLQRGRPRSILLGFTVLGLVYFPSTLFLLSSAGAEGARRSWAISWIGLAIFTAPVAIWLLDWAGQRVHVLSRATFRFGLAAVLVISLAGGTAAGLDPSYRFPGPFLYGSDSRSETAELGAMSQWFLQRFGPGNNIVTDRYTGLVIASFGLQNTATPSAGFPTYDLYLDKPGQPIGPAFLLADLSSSHYLYLIVDKRMALDTPRVGVYFEPDEPSSFVLANGQSVFKGRLSKFNTTLWMDKVFQSDNYSVYRMNLPVASVRYQDHEVKFQGKLSIG